MSNYRVIFIDPKTKTKVAETYIHGESYYTKALVKCKAIRQIHDYTNPEIRFDKLEVKIYEILQKIFPSSITK